MAQLSPENQSRLAQLADTLDLMEGEPALILAVAPGRAIQQRLRATLPEFCAAIAIETPLEFDVPVGAEEIYRPLQDFLAAHNEDISGAVAIVGLTELDNVALEACLKDLNRSREQFRHSLALPMVMWVDDRVRQMMTRQINDFKSWTTAIVFVPEPDLQQQWLREQGEKIQQGIEQSDEFQPNDRFLEAADAQELNNFLQQPITELNDRWQLPPDLAWEVQFWQGRHYLASSGQEPNPVRKALEIFQGLLESPLAPLSKGGIETDDPPQQRTWKLQGLVALHEAWAYQRLDQPEQAKAASDRALEMLRRGYGTEVWPRWWWQRWQVLLDLGQWQAVRAELEESVEIFDRLLRADFNQWWPYALVQNRVWACVNQNQGDTAGQQRRAAAGCDLWQTGRQRGETWRRWQGERLLLGQLALEMEEDPTGQERSIRDSLAAIDPETFLQVEANFGIWGLAKRWGRRLVDLVTQLRELLRQRGEHGEAFDWKQKQRQWELAFGLRAFMGAGQFQVTGNDVAAEALFAASGRGEDVRVLVEERLGLDAYKFLTLYGPSGVGKSTLVEAGLVPALRQHRFPGGRRGVPILVRVYEDWEGEVLKQLQTWDPPKSPLIRGTFEPVSPLPNGTFEPVPDPVHPLPNGTSDPVPPLSRGGKGDQIYDQLQRNADDRQATILVFDQFEEFFTSALVTDTDRQAFYQFVMELLRGRRAEFVKVVLSLREDYRPKLRELDRYGREQMQTELFDAEKTVYLGNFDPPRAETVITALAHRADYGLEPQLVKALVADLATEGGLVRPVQLQVVGAQLQAAQITTLAQYETYIGGKTSSILSSTAPLVDGYIEEVVRDCGEEREQNTAWGILLALTNAQGLRPIRSEQDLDVAVECFSTFQEMPLQESDRALVMRVLTESGLVVTWGEAEQRFQLVHDYLVYPIREQFRDYDFKQRWELRQARQTFEQQLELQETKQKEVVLRQENEVLAAASRKAGLRLLIATGASVAVVVGALSSAKNQLIRVEQNAQKQMQKAEIDASRIELEAKKNVEAAKQERQEALTLAMQAQEEAKEAESEAKAITAKAGAELAAAKAGVATATEQALAAQQQKENTQRELTEAQQLYNASQAKTVALEIEQQIATARLFVARGETSCSRYLCFEGMLAALPGLHLLRSLELNLEEANNIYLQTTKIASDFLQQVSEINRFQGHTDWVRSVVFSPDGKFIASGSDDRTIRLWDLHGKLLGEPFQGHESNIMSIAFSPDGKTIVSGSNDNTIRLWDLDGNPIGKPFYGHTEAVRSVAFSPDRKTIISGSNDNTIRLWDLDGNPIGKVFHGHTGAVLSVAFSPDGKNIVSGSVDNTIRLWDLDGNSIKLFNGHTDVVLSVAFSPDGQTIASCSNDKTVRIWNLQGSAIMQPFLGHASPVWSVDFSSDGKSIVSGSEDGEIRLWDLQGNPIGLPLAGHAGWILSTTFSPDDTLIASGSSDNTVRIWDLESKTNGQSFHGHTDSIKTVAFSPDGKSIVSGSDDHTLRLWDLKGNPIGQPFQGHTDSIRAVAFSPDGKSIVSGSDDHTLRLWDLKGNPIGQPFQGHENVILSIAFSPDGKFIVSGSGDNTLRLWDLKGQLITSPFQGHKSPVWSVAFNPNGKSIVSGSGNLDGDSDYTLRLWDLQGNLIAPPFQGHKSPVWSVAFSPDGKSIVSSGGNIAAAITGIADYTVRLWDLQGNLIAPVFQGHESPIWSVTFSPDGKSIISGSGNGLAPIIGIADNTVRIWDLQGNAIGEPLQGHKSPINSVDFSPDGKSIISGSSDNTVRIWDLSVETALNRTCDRLRDYLTTNPTVSDSDRALCGIPPRE